MSVISFATKKPKTAEAPKMQVTKEVVGEPITESFLPEEPKKPGVAFRTTTAVAPPPETSTAVARPLQSSQLEGEFGSRDIAVPYLAIAQKVSECVDEHPDWLGKWVFDKTNLVGETVRIVVFHMSKRYEEDLPYGSEDIPRRYQFADDARKEGAQVRDVADIDLFLELELADGEGDEFGAIRLDGKTYLPARYTVRSTAYGAMVKIIMKDLAGWLKSDLSSGFYKLAVDKRKGPKGSWFAPKLAPDGKVSAELRKLIAERSGH